jgi:hypothetical protein
VALKMSAKWYTPQLSREIVSRLYFKAKAERIRMTVLANRIMKQALDAEEVTECRRDMDNDIRVLPGLGERSEGPVNQQQSASRGARLRHSALRPRR